MQQAGTDEEELVERNHMPDVVFDEYVSALSDPESSSIHNSSGRYRFMVEQ
jgi:hypothetical protein